MAPQSRHTLVLTTLVIAALGGCNRSPSGPSSARVDQLFAQYNNTRSPGCRGVIVSDYVTLMVQILKENAQFGR